MPEQQQSGQDNSLDFLWIIAFAMGGIILVWYFGQVYITTAIFYVRLYEITFLDFIFNFLSKATQFIGLPSYQVDFSQWLVFIRGNLGAAASFSDLVSLSNFVGSYMRYPLSLLMLGGAALLYFGGASHRLRHTFNTKLLKTLEQENWPQITPVVDLDLVNAKLDEGPWAIGLSPVRFCKKHDLLDITEKRGQYTMTLRRGAAYRILSLQLGPQWKSVNALPIYLKALFAIFAARINEDKKSSEILLDQISASAKNGSKLSFAGVEELICKYGNSKKVNKIINLHGYVTTVLASMLVRAREVGVLASAEFIWFKPIDRRIWYMLNSVGRPTALPEICGAFAHWLAEKKLGLPLMVPMVDEAIKGLELALSEIIYKPEEE
ncbi:MAG: type IVB secretion system coupling complex protein DotM/IcmP [Coxiellaceae bacterium]|jgi:intracellular multiplication protein IcmP|nr:type IVB secretion system coupling complex protein DotM/IcmP [Coxiellaceae bacterium]